MGTITTIGLDIAKSVFQVHGIDAAGEGVVRRRLSRGRILAFFEKLPRCLVGMEACNTSHYWARELIALGHDVRLMPAQYVKPYVKRGKNDGAVEEPGTGLMRGGALSCASEIEAQLRDDGSTQAAQESCREPLEVDGSG